MNNPHLSITHLAQKCLLALSALTLFASCEVDFSPNDHWQEIPVVYCLLDQDDDTTFVRVQRCFLGEGNQYHYALIADSNNYPEGTLTVTLEEWAGAVDRNGTMTRSGNQPLRQFTLNYTEIIGKDSGLFSSASQPVYYLPSASLFDTSCIYRLVVVNNNTGKTIATAETPLIRGEMVLESPNDFVPFNFSGRGYNAECAIRWTTLRDARQYKPIVRFRYRDFIIDTTVLPPDTTITPHFIDIPGSTVKSDMHSSSITSVLLRSYFLSCIKSALEGDTVNKNIIDTVDITVICCSEPLTEYLFASNPVGTLNQEPFSYTNIEGGRGVFAARRRHITFTVRTPAVGGYVDAIKALGVGF